MSNSKCNRRARHSMRDTLPFAQDCGHPTSRFFDRATERWSRSEHDVVYSWTFVLELVSAVSHTFTSETELEITIRELREILDPNAYAKHLDGTARV